MGGTVTVPCQQLEGREGGEQEGEAGGHGPGEPGGSSAGPKAGGRLAGRDGWTRASVLGAPPSFLTGN